jgi:methylaspartate mutase sigma subunit
METKIGEERPLTLVLGVIGFDCHSVGNKILDAFFSEKGFRVVNLGVMVTQDEFISAAIESGADAILVSSLYGHGEIDCEGFRGRCIERGIGDIILWVGGNLVVGKTPFPEVEKKFLAMGFDRVFPADTDLEAAAADLRRSMLKRRQGDLESPWR